MSCLCVWGRVLRHVRSGGEERRVVGVVARGSTYDSSCGTCRAPPKPCLSIARSSHAHALTCLRRRPQLLISMADDAPPPEPTAMEPPEAGAGADDSEEVRMRHSFAAPSPALGGAQGGWCRPRDSLHSIRCHEHTRCSSPRHPTLDSRSLHGLPPFFPRFFCRPRVQRRRRWACRTR